MADPKIKLKRSSVEGKIPTPDQVPLGEIALNTYDGYLYASKNVGVGTTVIAINPFRVGTGTNTYNAYFTAGNVGIGSEIPNRKLVVEGSGNTFLSVKAGTSDDVGLIFGDTDSDAKGLVRYANSDDSLRLWTNTTERLRITSAGNVGIGSEIPTTKLDVDGTVTATGASITGNIDITGNLDVTGVSTATNSVSIKSDDGTPGRVDLYCEVSNAHYARIQAPDHSDFSGNITLTLPSSTGTLLNSDGSGASLTGLTGASAATYGNSSATPVIVVDSNGRITGISTVAISGGGSGASEAFKTISVSGQSDVVADSATDTLTLVAGSNMTITTNASGDSITFVSSGGGGGGGLFAETDVGIHTLTNVGIGTTNPIAKLEVNVGSAVTALDIQGSEGQLFSVTNQLSSGSIFSVNDISGIPSIDVDADGTIQLAPYGTGEKVGIGTTEPKEKLHVVGVVSATSFFGDGSNLSNITSSAGVGVNSGGTNIGYGITTLNFIGSGTTIEVSGTTATISAGSGGGGSVSEAFKTISVSGQSDVVADSATDTLTLVAGSNMTITTNASGDSITFASSGGGGGGGLFAETDVGIHTLSNVGIGTTNPIAKLEVNVGSAVTALDIQGSEGQLFSVTNQLSSGSIFSVNDISGIPSIDVDADGTIQLAPYGTSEKIGIGTTEPKEKLHVVGVVSATSFYGDGSSLTGLSGGLFVSNDTGIHTTSNVGVGTTTANGAADTNNTTVLNAGIVTANYYYGDGSNLTGISGGSSGPDPVIMGMIF